MPEERDILLDATQSRPRADSGNAPLLKKLKIILPITAVGLAIMTFTWTFIASDMAKIIPAEEILSAVARNELLKPRFESMDDQGQPFTISAESATRSDESNKNSPITLTKPAGDILLKNGRWVAIKAYRGTYSQEKKYLSLEEQVELYDDQGYTLTTAQMDIDIHAQTIAAPSPVSAQGPTGSLKALAMQGTTKTGLLTFAGPATLTLTLPSGSGIGDIRQ